MAHNLDMSNGRANMAYRGVAPWHKLGTSMNPEATIEEWKEAAGFFEIKSTEFKYIDDDGFAHYYPDRVVLYRSDTKAPLSIMSDHYKIVQPEQILDFFHDVCTSQAWDMETAGVLKDGKVYWALARAGLNGWVGDMNDRHELFMLLATSCDGSSSTSAVATDIRVVCDNTLTMALKGEGGRRINVRHNALFDPDKIKRELGMVDFDTTWNEFIQQMKTLSEVDVTDDEARQFFSDLIRPPKTEKGKFKDDPNLSDFDRLMGTSMKAPIKGRVFLSDTDSDRKIRGLEDVMMSYYTAPGSTPGTAYGLLNGVTHWVDHVRNSNLDRRLTSSWFGSGLALKDRAVESLNDLLKAKGA